MPLVALGWLCIAALMHAGWNIFLKQAKVKQLFIWWAMLAGSACFSLIFFVDRALPVSIWPYALSSAGMETLYYIALTWAYDSDDFSLTYPLARGASPALLAIWAALFLNESPRAGGILGLIILVLGLIIVGSASAWSRLQHTHFSAKGIIASLLAAGCISIYSTIDGAAVRLVSPLPYTVLILSMTAFLFAPVVYIRYGPRLMIAEWCVNWRRIIFVGVSMILTYIIVLQAYTLWRVSYAGAVREISIVFAALIGWLWMGEKFGLLRTLGAALIFVGIIIIAIAG